eukprot:TRINITY_DN2985_c0_g1_i4.p1 TRINITY_DN2985_c0_g1~~TRINITY_DN2985_c0_g1_i4.p1  ORF type:complete len:619 (+),score=123.23 TRINITY_DN2985_c0_g1_i4:60-1916(+)
MSRALLPLVITAAGVFGAASLWLIVTKRPPTPAPQVIPAVVFAGRSIELDGDLDALRASMEHKSEEDSNGRSTSNFFVRSSFDNIKMTAKMQSISLRGLCSTFSSCQSCLTNNLCSWCAQLDSTDWQEQRCIPTGMPCEDKVQRSCEVSLLRTPQREVCAAVLHESSETASVAGAAALQDALRHWGYVVRRPDDDGRCIDLLKRDCAPLENTRKRKAVAWQSGDDTCPEQRSPLLLRVPPVRRMNKMHLKNVLCNSVEVRKALLDGDSVRGVQITIASSLQKWVKQAATSGVCLVDSTNDQIAFSYEALRAGCYPMAIDSKWLKHNIEQNVIPRRYVYQTAVNFSRELPNFVVDKGLEKYDTYLSEIDEHLLLDFRKRVRQHLQADVHIVGLVAVQDDVDGLLGFLVTTIVQLPSATIEVMMCPGYQQKDLSAEVQDNLRILMKHGVLGAVTFTHISGPVCRNQATLLQLPTHPPSPPAYLMHFFSLNLTVLSEELVSTMATQQQQVQSGAVLLEEGVLLSEHRNSTCLKSLSSARDVGDIAQQSCVYASSLYISDRDLGGAESSGMQLVSTLSNMREPLERMLALMRVVSKLCALPFYSTEFQSQVHHLLRCSVGGR